MGVHKNTFTKGLNKDTAKQKYPQDQYEDARNVRPITDSGLSTGALENIKGTTQIYDFPEINGSTAIILNKKAYEDNTVVKSETINLKFAPGWGSPYTTETIINFNFQFKTPEEFFAQLISSLDTFNLNLAASDRLKLYYSSETDSLVIYSPLFPLDNQINSSPLVYSNIIVAGLQRLFTIIGSVPIRGSNILFTVGEKLSAEDAVGYGQIWKADYDTEYPTQDNTLELIYSGDLNFGS